MSIYETVIEENLGDPYWWAKWPQSPTKEEKEAIDFILAQYPRSITLSVQKVADLLVEYRQELEKSSLAVIQRAIAKFLRTEGCSCCEGPCHDKYREELLELLQFPRYDDSSGYNFYDFPIEENQEIK